MSTEAAPHKQANTQANKPFFDSLQQTLDQLREQGLYKQERVLASRQGAEVVCDDGRSLINMCANNYLGLAGDLQTLNRFYRVGLRGGQSQWRLVLTPSEQKMQGVVREIQFGGSGDWVNVIEVLETSGDRSVMTISRDDS